MAYRVGVDVGGTFTDVLLVDDSTGQMWRAKTPSTPEDQSIGVLKGVAKVCNAAGIRIGDLAEFLHGTTVATNAILEGKGAKVGLVTTHGFRYVLQIARSFVPGGIAGWIIWPKPEPLAALDNTIEANERISADGTVVQELDEVDIREKLIDLGQRGIESLTISLINSYVNDRHEARIAEIAADVLPGVPISRSARVLPEMREYERTITTVANSYVQPQVAKYIGNLADSISAAGFRGELFILRSDGGLASASAAVQDPVRLLLSGPAGGVSGAVWVAEQTGFPDFLTFDMGGTSTDVALVQGLRPRIGRETTVGDLTVRGAAVDVRTVGSGGGSIAHVPPLTKALRVGPESAGASPGPAAYGHGGTSATVTDANVVLGYLPTVLAGGEVTLDADASRLAVSRIRDDMGLGTVEAAAAGIVDIVNENMYGALRLVSVQQGYDPRDFALVAFGGAGPLHANALGRLIGAWPVIIPPSPGVLCAYGDATTSIRHEKGRTFIRRFGDVESSELIDSLLELRDEAARDIEHSGVPRSEQSSRFEVDVRYFGQGFELPIDVDATLLDFPDKLLEAVKVAFDAEHERLCSYVLPNEHEIVNVRALVWGPRPEGASARELPPGDQRVPDAAVIESRDIWVDGAVVAASVVDRSALLSGNEILGPAVIVEMDSTTLVLPNHCALVHPSGSLLIRPTNGL